MWKEGTIGIPKTEGRYKVIHYSIKHFEEPSKVYGIDGGRISKLTLKGEDEIICNYDRGWDIKPTCKEAEMALIILLNSHN
ncbi:MAG: hypothetical protein RSD10_04765 [Anaerovoracaceae bacterium]